MPKKSAKGVLCVCLGMCGAFLLSAVVPPQAEAASAYNEPVQITTQPGEDFAPAVSPDGKFLVYVSDQSGNLDLWLKSLEPGSPPPDRRLTFHSAQDNAPAVSPDGRSVAFVSNRSDARGDIYVLSLDAGEAKTQSNIIHVGGGSPRAEEAAITRLTDLDSEDADPAWSPDGAFIYFSSRAADADQKKIFKINLSTRTKSQVTQIQGVNPAVSRDGRYLAFVSGEKGATGNLWVMDLKKKLTAQITSGPEIDVSPKWAPDGRSLIFTRYAYDTNHDGRISIEDQPSIWQAEFSVASAPAKLRQLTDSSIYNLQAEVLGDRLYFTSNRKTGVDVWMLPLDGMLPRQKDYGRALQQVVDLCPVTDTSYACLMAYGNLVREFDGEPGLGRIRLRWGQIYRELNHRSHAEAAFRTIAQRHPQDEVHRALAEIELLTLGVSRARDEEGPAAFKEKIQKAISRLGKMYVMNQGEPAILARALIERGHLHRELKENVQAIDYYKKVVAKYPGQRWDSAEAAFSLSRIYLTLNDQEKLIESFVQVVRDFYDVQYWARQAIHEILELHEKQPTLEKKIASLQKLAEEQKVLPVLAAAVQNRIGEIFHREHENLLAKESYRKTVELYPQADIERSIALFALAQIFAEEENFEKSVEIYTQIGRETGVTPRNATRARDGYIRKTVDKGKWEMKVGELRLAVKTFRQLIDYAPESVEAHRGYIQAEAGLKQAPHAVRFYQDRVSAKPSSHVDIYGLGLALTYLDPPALDAAEAHLRQALVGNAMEPYYHQTLGWVYEQKDRVKPGHLERAVAEYQSALALNDEAVNPVNEADLLLNLGNGQFLLKNHLPAYLYYKKRQKANVDFNEPDRETIYHQRFGEAAFKSGFPDEAVEHYRKALDLLMKKKDADVNRIAELNDRIALAYQDGGRHAPAVEYFSKTLELHRQRGNNESLARTLRNIANNLYALNQSRDERNERELDRALEYYRDAMDKLEQYGVVQKAAKKSGGGLVDVKVETGLDQNASQAAMGFDKAAEQKLIFSYIGRIYGDFGEYARAIESFRKKLALVPAGTDPKKDLAHILERALTLNQIGNFYFHSGQFAESAEAFRESYQLSRTIENTQGVAVNAANLGRVLMTRAIATPAGRLRGEAEATVRLIEEALAFVDGAANFANPEYRIYLRNDLGLIAHYLSLHAEAGAPPPVAATVPAETAVKSDPALAWLRGELAAAENEVVWLKKSEKIFEEALNLAGTEFKSGPLRDRLEEGLEQNLKLTRHLLGREQKEKDKSPVWPLASLWKKKYLHHFGAGAENKVKELIEAERLLDVLPYNLRPGDFESRLLQEEMYLALTRRLFEQKRFAEALRYSETGLQQTLIALRQDLPLRFEDESRRALHEALKAAAGKVAELASLAENEESAGKLKKALEAYREVLSRAGEADPEFASLFAPWVPDSAAVQKLLREGEALVKLQLVHDKVLIWAVTRDNVFGMAVNGPKDLFAMLARAGHAGETFAPAEMQTLSAALLTPLNQVLSGTRQLYLLPAGALEFLPWPEMTHAGKPLAESLQLAFVSSLAQFRQVNDKKNLYTSRLLAAETSDTLFREIGKQFPWAEQLGAGSGAAEEFLQRARHFGVVSVGGKTQLARLNPRTTYINLAGRSGRFERVGIEHLLSRRVESNFIALAEVEYEMDPESTVSPTAPMLQALSFMGYPGMLLHFGAAEAKAQDEFLELFYRDFRAGRPAEALRKAQMEWRKRHPESREWANYRFYGFPGMTPEERNAFARKHYDANLQRGAEAFREKQWEAAIGWFEKAMTLLDQIEDKSDAPQLLKVMAEAAYNLEDYNKAVGYQVRLVGLMEEKKEPEAIAEAVHFLGILYSRAEDYVKAAEQLNRALKIYQENEILDKLADSYSVLGIVNENALDYAKALEAFSSSLKINKEIGEMVNQGRELRRIGRIFYLRLSDYVQARQYYAAAKAVFEKAGQRDQIVESLLELGLVAERQGDFPEAMKRYSEARTLAESIGYQAGLSKAYLYEANTHWFQADYQQAFRLQKKALDLAEESGDHLQQAFIHNTLGLIHWTLNDYERALASLGRSLKLAESARSLLDVASAYNNIGLVYRKQEKYPESIEYFSKALERDEKLKSRWAQAYTHRNLGMSYMRMKRLDLAGEHIGKAVALSREVGDRNNLVKSLLELGHLYVERGDCAAALPMFAETGKLAEALNVREVHWRALRGEGVCLAGMKRGEEAVAAYKKAVEVVDRMRAAIKVEEFQNGFLTDKQDVYRELILLLLDQGRVEESFVFAERAKSRSFIDLLGNRKINLKNDNSRKLYERLTAQQQKVRRAEENLGRAVGNDEMFRKAKEEMVGERRIYEDLLIEVKAANPELSSFVTVDVLGTADLYKLLDENVALVEYLVAKDELVAWTVTRGRIRVTRTPVKSAELEELIKDFRNRMQQSAPLEEQSARLYALLIQPVEGQIRDKAVWGIIPHGYLHYVSFAALRDAQGYLIEKHPLFYSPSASVLKFTFARKFEKSGAVKVLALGNPDLKDFNYDLPLAELEAQSIRWDFPQIDILTRERATERWVQENISSYQIIHIASHGEFDSVNPLFSSLKLVSDKSYDGNLEVSEVFSLDIKADLVTLSACQTGLGQLTGGDELVGLNRAFIYAGTHAIVSSLWRVSDVSTAMLIKHFYRNYAGGNKVDSLRKAQLLVKSLYPHPAYWAGFTLTGDYR